MGLLSDEGVQSALTLRKAREISVAWFKAFSACTAIVGMGEVIVRPGGAHGIQAPIDGGGGIAVFPEICAADVACERGLCAQAAANTRLLLQDVQLAHAAAPCVFTPAARKIVRRMMASKIGIL